MSPKDWPLRPLPDSANQLPARLGDFDCGKPSLDAFLKKTALFNQQTGVCRTVICQPATDLQVVAGYYSLAIAALPHDDLPARVRRRLINQPMQAVPLIARLAVDQRFQGHGLGARLLIAALGDVVQAWEKVGGPVVAVQPIDEQAVKFYERFGFVAVHGAPHMFMRISTARKALGLE